MKSQSAKRAREQRQRIKVVKQLLRERGSMCEAALPVCDGRAVDAHERLARSAGGSITDGDNLLLVCRDCHSWIGSNPNRATELGLRESRYGGTT